MSIISLNDYTDQVSSIAKENYIKEKKGHQKHSVRRKDKYGNNRKG